MSQVYGLDNIPDLVIGSTTTVTMAPTYLGKDTRITVGGQQNRYTSTITINFATTGLNALDTGAIAVNTLYYIYAVRSGVIPGLVASTAVPATGPTGYSSWKEIGRCRTLLAAATLSTITNRDGLQPRSISSPSISWTPTSSWGATNTTYTGLYERRANKGAFHVKIALSGAPVNSPLAITLPNSWSMDTSSLVTGTNNGSANVLEGANASIQDTGTATLLNATVAYSSLVQVGLYYADSSTAMLTAGGVLNTSNPIVWASGDLIVIQFTVPIAEWQGLYT